MNERSRGTRFCLITHNTKDFSDPNRDNRRPHPDLAPSFTRIRSLYFVNLAEALKRFRPALVTELMLEYEGWDQRPQPLSEVLEAIDEIVNKVWYDCHKGREVGVAHGKIKIVEREEAARLNYANSVISRDIWEGALRSALKVEKQFGNKNLGPWSDFEWEMINGKLSALRLFLGEDWDELYT